MIPEKNKKYHISFRHPQWPEFDYHGIAICNGELEDGFGKENEFEQWYGFEILDCNYTVFYNESDIIAEVKN